MTAHSLSVMFDATPDGARMRGGHGRREVPQMTLAGWHEGGPVQMMARCRLDTGAVCGAEAQMPAQGRMAAGTLLERIGGMARAAEVYGRLAIGVGAGDLAVSRLAGKLGEALGDTKLALDRVELVLPEAALLELDEAGVLALAALSDAGVALTLDEFGAGIASLTMLRRLPLSAIKLARMIVRGLPEDCEDAAVVRAAISMAHAMGLAVIGDGVDTEAQRGLLAHWGCDEGQGALFGPVRWLN